MGETTPLVTLITHTPEPEKVIACAAKLCYSQKSGAVLNYDMTLEEAKEFLGKLPSTHGTPFEHATFTFSIEGISRACYDDKTEILTREGWKLFKDLKESDEVAVLDPDGCAYFEKPKKHISYFYDGAMHYYKSQNCDLAVTPNHKMYCKPHDVRTYRDFELIPSYEITQNKIRMTKEFVMPDGDESYYPFKIAGFYYKRRNKNGEYYEKKTKDLEFERENFFKFLAWYLSDGSVYHDKKENKYVISICQTQCDSNIKNNTIGDITKIINDMGLKCNYDGKAIRTTNMTLGKWLHDLGKSYEKNIPFDLEKNFNRRLAKIFIDEYMRGDGCNSGTYGNLYTTSPKLADKLYTLCFMAGYTASLYIDTRTASHAINGQEVNRNYPLYSIQMSLSGKRNYKPLIKRDRHLTIEHYTGMVYCVEVTDHVVFVRRNGIAMWCGNCSHELVRHRMANHNQRSQRYVMEGSFNYVIPEVIKGNTHTAVPFDYNDDEDDFNTHLSIEEVFEYAMGSAKDYYDILLNALKESGIPEKVAFENARYVLPNACETKNMLTMNVRELHHFFNQRCCCFDEDTEVLTSNGWKKFNELNGDEKFYSLNLETGENEYSNALNHFEYDYDGEMVRVNSQS